jgi:hypothetical protein
VNYTLAGTAAASSYTASPPLSGSITFPDGDLALTITITPTGADTNSTDDTIIVTVASSDTYNVGTPNSATVTILDITP